jgi:hypothetical protein
VPLEKLDEMQRAAGELAAREQKMIAAARAPGATIDQIKAAIAGG